jgi:hypothetical protein
VLGIHACAQGMQLMHPPELLVYHGPSAERYGLGTALTCTWISHMCPFMAAAGCQGRWLLHPLI